MTMTTIARKNEVVGRWSPVVCLSLVADLAPASRRGLAFGIYNAVLGVGQLAASVLFGLLWTAFGPAAAFAAGAALAVLATAVLFVVVRR